MADRPLRVVPADEYEQIVRLAAFRVRYPDVVVGDLGFGGVWQARIPEPDGEIVLTSHLLGELLDKLDGLLGS